MLITVPVLEVLLAMVGDTVFLQRMDVLTKLILLLPLMSFLRRPGVLVSGSLFLPLQCYYRLGLRRQVFHNLGEIGMTQLIYVACEDSGAGRRD